MNSNDNEEAKMEIRKSIDGIECINPFGFSRLLDVSKQCVVKWIRLNRIAGIKIGSRYWIPLNEVLRVKMPVGLSVEK